MRGSFCQRTEKHSQQRDSVQRRQRHPHWNSTHAATPGKSTAGSSWPTGELAKKLQGFLTDCVPRLLPCYITTDWIMMWRNTWRSPLSIFRMVSHVWWYHRKTVWCRLSSSLISSRNSAGYATDKGQCYMSLVFIFVLLFSFENSQKIWLLC